MRRAVALLAVAWLTVAVAVPALGASETHRAGASRGVVTTLTVVEAEVRSEPLP